MAKGDQRLKYHLLQLTLNVTTESGGGIVRQSSTTRYSLSEDYSRPDNYTRQTTDSFKPFTLKPCNTEP